MRPPSKRGTAVVPMDHQRTSSLFKKMSLRSWQEQYKAQQNGRGDEGKASAGSDRS